MKEKIKLQLFATSREFRNDREALWQFISQALDEYADWKIKECLPDKLPNDVDSYKHTRDFTGYYDKGFNACIDQILSNKDKVK